MNKRYEKRKIKNCLIILNNEYLQVVSVTKKELIVNTSYKT